VQGLRVPRLQPFVVLEHVIERAVDDGVEPGHSSIAITGDIYGHTFDATTRAAIDGLSTRSGCPSRLADGPHGDEASRMVHSTTCFTAQFTSRHSHGCPNYCNGPRCNDRATLPRL
jgi:hypothetical protein